MMPSISTVSANPNQAENQDSSSPDFIVLIVRLISPKSPPPFAASSKSFEISLDHGAFSGKYPSVASKKDDKVMKFGERLPFQYYPHLAANLHLSSSIYHCFVFDFFCAACGTQRSREEASSL